MSPNETLGCSPGVVWLVCNSISSITSTAVQTATENQRTSLACDASTSYASLARDMHHMHVRRSSAAPTDSHAPVPLAPPCSRSPVAPAPVPLDVDARDEPRSTLASSRTTPCSPVPTEKTDNGTRSIAETDMYAEFDTINVSSTLSPLSVC